MYTEFYGLTEKPFGLVPNPTYLYLSERHQKSLTYLEYGLTEKSGFILLTGDVGMGKTTLIRHLLNRIEPNTEIAVIFNTILPSDDLLRLILAEFEIKFDPGLNKSAALELLYSHLIQSYARGRKMLLIIDEAQNLSTDVLEEIRMLSNLQTDNEQLLQIMLVGQPQLQRKLRKPELSQLAQRIGVSCHLSPMTENDVRAYIDHRLRVAGSDEKLFSDKAMERIAEVSGGIPRVVNLLCDACLVYGFADELREISENVVSQVIEDKGGIGLYLSYSREGGDGLNDDSGDPSVNDPFLQERKSDQAVSNCKDSIYNDLHRRLDALDADIAEMRIQFEKQISEMTSQVKYCRTSMIKYLLRLLMIEKKIAHFGRLPDAIDPDEKEDGFLFLE